MRTETTASGGVGLGRGRRMSRQRKREPLGSGVWVGAVDCADGLGGSDHCAAFAASSLDRVCGPGGDPLCLTRDDLPRRARSLARRSKVTMRGDRIPCLPLRPPLGRPQEFEAGA
jgi:hypothetical protein